MLYRSLLLVTALIAFSGLTLAAGRPVVSVLDYGPAGRGGDDTAVFQRALDTAAAKGLALRVPAAERPYTVQPLAVPSNTDLRLDKGAILQAAPGYARYEHLLNIDGVQDVTVTGYGATLRMPKAEYAEGEWRHTLSIQGSTNVTVKGLHCNDSGGDGVYISGGEGKHYSEHVLLEDVSCDNNRRQGISIISARDLIVRRCRFTNTQGTAPEDGIDVEPNSPEDRLVGIRIEDCVTAGNRGDGVGICIWKLDSTSQPVDIRVLRHRDRDSGKAGFLGTGDQFAERDVKGTVRFEQCTTERSGEAGAAAVFWESTGPLLVFQDLTIVDPNRSGKALDKAAVMIKRGGGAPGPMGGVHVLHPTITARAGRVDYYFTVHDWSNIGIHNLRFVPGPLRGAAKHPYGLYEGKEAERLEVP